MDRGGPSCYRRAMTVTIFRARLAPGTTLTRVEGKDVLFSTRTGETFGLNETAAAMLARIVASDSMQAARTLAAEYAAPEDEIASDLRSLVDELARLKLVEIS